MSDSERISARRRIPATAAEIFAVIKDPAGHVRIDGSGMLVAAPDAKPVTGVDDTFEIDMDRRPLNDLPGVTDYRVVNTITVFSENRQLEWGVSQPGRPPVGYVWGYLIEPVSAEVCDVTSYFDWSGLSQRRKDNGFNRPLLPATTLASTLERLEAAVVGA